uniref:Bm389, isoform a n=1 Tax=Brugia malayi TaxID=6279 RepID=A0A1I9G1A6_BRUMA|nr:Bm389, isoform a [Brugia malayi]
MIKRNVEVELVLSAGGGVYSEWSRGSVLRFVIFCVQQLMLEEY